MICFLFYRAQAPQDYASGQAGLNLYAGMINTLMLLTSSWLLALAVKAMRTTAEAARPLTVGAVLFGLGFLAGKIFEYVQKARDGFQPQETEFYTFYFVFTGIHFVHVRVCLALILLMSRGS